MVYSDIKYLYELIRMYGFRVKTTGMDGLTAWNAVKALLLAAFGTTKISWTPSQTKILDEIKALGVTDQEEKDSGLQHAEWERHHFLVQHGRIVNLNYPDPGIIRLFQIAYNTGQLYAVFNHPFYTKAHRDMFFGMQLDQIDTYVDRGQLESIPKINTTPIIDHLLPAVQKGGTRFRLTDSVAVTLTNT